MNNPYENEFDANQIVEENVQIFTDVVLTTDGSGNYIISSADPVGLFQGAVTITDSLPMFELKTGVPKTLRKTFIQELQWDAKTEALEFTSKNLCFGMGVSKALREIWDGLTEYDRFWEDAAEDQQLLQLRPGRGLSWNRARFAHKGIKMATDVPVLKVYPGSPVKPWTALTVFNVGDIIEPTTPGDYYYICSTSGTSGATEPSPWGSTPDGTTSDGTAVWTCKAWIIGVSGTDYYIGASQGELFALPGGAFTTTDRMQILAKYKAIPLACEIVPLKQTGFVSWTGSVLITGIDVNTNKRRWFYIPKAEVSSTGIKTAAAGVWSLGITITALDNPDTPDYPLGWELKDVESTAA